MTKQPKIRVVGKRRVDHTTDPDTLDMCGIFFDEEGHMCVATEIAAGSPEAATELVRREARFAEAVRKLTPSGYAIYLRLAQAVEDQSSGINERIRNRTPHLLAFLTIPDESWRETVQEAFHAIVSGLATKSLAVPTSVGHHWPRKTKYDREVRMAAVFEDLPKIHVCVTQLLDDRIPGAMVPIVDLYGELHALPPEFLTRAVAREHPGWGGAWPTDLPAASFRPETLDVACVRAADGDGVAALVRAIGAQEDPDAGPKAEEKPASTKTNGIEVLRPTRPTLDDLHGYGKAAGWGDMLATDVDLYKRGKLGWADVDCGCLMSGPPGTGKTMFAGALAATCDLAFIPTSFAHWTATGRSYQGDTIAAMRKTFAAAAENAPCVLFIDEIDSVPSRGSSARHDDYWVPIVNALLECLDGTTRREGVIVIAACNDPSGLDPALVRSGRLDRRFEIELPDEQALLGIMRHHLPDADAESLRPAATALAGSTSGADVQRIAREARRTARRQDRSVTAGDLMAIAMPPDERPAALRRLAAVHEAGHAVVGLLQGRDIRSASILAAPGVHGGVQFGVLDPVHARDVADIAILYLAGRAAEAVVLGTTSLGSGGAVHSDLAQATNLIAGAVAGGGVGPLTVGLQPDGVGVERQLQRLYGEALVMISRHRPVVEALADMLLERRVLGSTALLEFAQAHGLGGH